MKKSRISTRTLLCAAATVAATSVTIATGARLRLNTGSRCRSQRGGAFTTSTSRPGQEEELGQLRPGGRGDDEQHGEDAPQQRIPPVDLARQLVGGDGDDGDDGGTDAVEDGLHPPEPAVGDVERGKDEHHQERGQHERHPDDGGAEHALREVADGDGELGGQRTGHDLGERQSELVLLVVDPLPALHQIALHVADQRYRPPKPVVPSLRK